MGARSVRSRVWLGIVGVLVGASVTVLVTSIVPSEATEPGLATDPAQAAQLAQVHLVAAHQRTQLGRQHAQARLRAERARVVARERAMRTRIRAEQRQQRWIAPVTGYTLSDGFGVAGPHWISGYHTGQDFAVPYGSTVHAAHTGTVTFAGWGGRYGHVIEITHSGGVETWYAHLSVIGVSVGEDVRTGEAIGATGCSGNCFGTHLHFEVRLGHDTPVDPVVWLRLRGVHL